MAAPTHLDPVVAPVGERPPDIGTGHPMREVTERVAADPAAWTPDEAARVAELFGSMAAGWSARSVAGHGPAALADALDRGGHGGGHAAHRRNGGGAEPVVELGAGTGEGTAVLAERFGTVVAVDLAAEMLAHLSVPGAARVHGDASRLPLRDGAVGTLVCMNMFLFVDEVRRVLRDDGQLVWVSTLGEHTPIYLSAEAVGAALGEGFAVVASRAGWSTWCVARRAGGGEDRGPVRPA